VKISQNGIDLIKRFEGCKLTAYDDVAGVLTIGYGHTLGVIPNQTITQAQADQFLLDDLVPVEGTINDVVKVGLNQNQYDALCSFVFNVGSAAFRASTMLKMLNAKDYTSAGLQFARWNHASGHVVDGLTARRAAEAQLFVAPVSGDHPSGATNVVPDAPPSKVTHTTIGRRTIGMIATGGTAAIIQGVQQAKPVIDAAQSVVSSTASFPDWLKLASVIGVGAAIVFAFAALWHKQKDMNP
jgi:lysozyme